MRLRIVISTLLIAQIGITFGQDAQFTQFYAAPTYLNPAFAGTSIQSRLAANYRNQWTAIPGAFVTYNCSFDHYAPQLNSGFGFLATYDRAGSGALGNVSLSAQYAYEVRLRRNLFLRPALQFTYTNRQINFQKLTFGDQLIRGNGDPTLEEAIIDPVNFYDFSGGMLLTSPRLWLGASVHHINRPNESLYQENFSFLSAKLSVHGGYRIVFKKRFRKNIYNTLFAFNYRSQGQFDQLDIGAYYEMNPFIFGIWYRGLPVKSNSYGKPNHDAVSIILGWQQGPYKVGYSYDITISQLGVGSSGGSHEISIIYEWANKRNKRLARRRIIPCAKF